MSSGVETIDIIDTWLWSTFSTDATLLGLIGDQDSIISTLAVAGVHPPYVVFSLSSARDIVAVPMIRVQVDAIYTVKAVSEAASWTQVRQVSARLDTLINGVNATTPNGSVSCYRESIIQYAEVSDATQFRHSGGTYRIRANSL